MVWRYLYYNDEVKLALETRLDSGHLADLLMAKRILEEFGPHELPSKLSKALGNGLFEFRLSGLEGIERVFYCYLSGQRLVYLHSFAKTTQKTPLRELRTAEARLAEVMRQERAAAVQARKGKKNHAQR